MLEPIIRAVLGLPAKARRWYLFQCTVVGQRGLEPRTSVLSGLRSNRLSYWPKGEQGDVRGHPEYIGAVGGASTTIAAGDVAPP